VTSSLFAQQTFQILTLFTVIPLASPLPHVGSQALFAVQKAFALPFVLSAHGFPPYPSLNQHGQQHCRTESDRKSLLPIATGSADGDVENQIELLVERSVGLGRNTPRITLRQVVRLHVAPRGAVYSPGVRFRDSPWRRSCLERRGLPTSCQMERRGFAVRKS
jgi:hypothetical protein